MIDLSLGDLSTIAPLEPLAKLVKRLETMPLGYQPAQGIPALCDLSRAYFNIPEDYSVIVTAGASMAITLALTSICKTGDEVLLPYVGYPGTFAAVKALGLVPKYYQFTNGELKIVGDDSITPKVTILNSPHNPTGQIASTQEVTSILKYCASVESILISDEVYRELVYDGIFRSPIESLEEVTIFQVQSLSKSCALSGWRIGFLIVPQDWEERLQRTHRAIAMCASIPSQLLAYELFSWSNLKIWQSSLLERLHHRRNYSAAILHKAGLQFEIPAAGPFLWMDVGGLKVNGDTFTQALYSYMNVLLAPGSQFTIEPNNHVRLCFGSCNDKELEEAVTKIVAMTEKLSSIVLQRKR